MCIIVDLIVFFLFESIIYNSKISPFKNAFYLYVVLRHTNFAVPVNELHLPSSKQIMRSSFTEKLGLNVETFLITRQTQW